MDNHFMVKSWTGYIISYGDCLIFWSSNLQTNVVLSSTESKYVGLSASLGITILVMNELKAFGIHISKTTPTIFCKLFKYNEGEIHLARAPKMHPRTRHINQKYHHFREWVKSGLIYLLLIDTIEQPAKLSPSSSVMPSRDGKATFLPISTSL
jgi:hypothetical protein